MAVFVFGFEFAVVVGVAGAVAVVVVDAVGTAVAVGVAGADAVVVGVVDAVGAVVGAVVAGVVAMTAAFHDRMLTHYHLQLGQTTMLRSLLKYKGPAHDMMHDRYPEHFLRSVFIKKRDSVQYKLEIELEGRIRSATDKRLKVHDRAHGRVEHKFAAAIMECADKLYSLYVALVGEVTSEPPKDCPNEIHRDWHVDHSALNAPTFAPDDGNWRCIGCGWLLDSDGHRIREQFMPQTNTGQTTKKKGSYRGQG